MINIILNLNNEKRYATVALDKYPEYKPDKYDNAAEVAKVKIYQNNSKHSKLIFSS